MGKLIMKERYRVNVAPPIVENSFNKRGMS
jgi:hypothetical protein